MNNKQNQYYVGHTLPSNQTKDLFTRPQVIPPLPLSLSLGQLLRSHCGKPVTALHGMNVSSTIIFIGLCLRFAMYNIHIDLPALVEKYCKPTKEKKVQMYFRTTVYTRLIPVNQNLKV